MRVRIHLNLARSENAETTIRMYNPSTGGWPTVGYAESIVLENITPIVSDVIAHRIATGDLKHKTPHAFLEGDLVSWAGTVSNRPANNDLQDQINQKRIDANQNVVTPFQSVFNHACFVGYNPKFASCFYRHQSKKEDIVDRFISAHTLVACGWLFFADGAVFNAMVPGDYIASQPSASDFEKSTIPKGFEISRKRMRSLMPL